MHYYTICQKGQFYLVSNSGEITQYGPNARFSGQWKIQGISFHHWANHFIPWAEIKERLDKGEVFECYIWDLDHGTTRRWGNGKARIHYSTLVATGEDYI